MRFALCAIAALSLLGCGTEPASRQSKLYPAGEKAAVGRLTYSVIDTQVLPRLGDDAGGGRTPQNRFYLVQIAVSNGGSTDLPVPGMSLIDDAGKVYPELADGTGVPQWLGVLRKVGPGQTERGNVAFDAPARRMKLKLTDDTDEADVMVEVPLSYSNQLGEGGAVPNPLPLPATPGAAPSPASPASRR